MKIKRHAFAITLCALMATFVSSGCMMGMPGLNGLNQNQQGTGTGTGTGTGGGGGTIITPDPTGYYAGINPNTSDLLQQLQTLNSQKKKRSVGYTAMLSNASQGYYVTDPGTGTNTIQPFYDGGSHSGTSGLNREHVWPNSRGGNYVDDDIHMTRPTLTSSNSSRGNEFYVEGKHGPAKPYKETGWDPGAFSEMDATFRGDSARIIFYCCVASSKLTLVDKTDDDEDNNTMGKLSDLLKWNLNYPVQQREKTRNEGAERLQGNRNPFVDHPEYACRIWGLTNATTRSICGM